MIDCDGRRVLAVAASRNFGADAVGVPSERVDAPSVDAAVQRLHELPPFDLILINTAAAGDVAPDVATKIRKHAGDTPIVLLADPMGTAGHDAASGKTPSAGESSVVVQPRLPVQRCHGPDAIYGTTHHRVLVAEDDRFVLRMLERTLTKFGYDVLTAADGREAFRKLLDKGADIVVSDWMMPNMDGLDLCRAVRAHESVGFVYFLVLTALSERSRLFEAFEAGADDFLTKPCDRGELLLRMRAGSRIVELQEDIAKRNRELHKVNADMAILNNRFMRMAVTDELTGLTNRRSAIQKLYELWNIANRYKLPFSIITLDIDHFKNINDTYGHDAGDVVLKAVSREIENAARTTDVVARIGGEEFLVITPNTSIDEAAILAERIRSCVEDTRIKHRGKQLSVTASLGLAQKQDTDADPEALLKRADVALYHAKDAGRNRCTAASPELLQSTELTQPAR